MELEELVYGGALRRRSFFNCNAYHFRARTSSEVARNQAWCGRDWGNWCMGLFVGVGVGLPCTVMECGDIIYRSTLPRSNGLTITTTGVLLGMAAIPYLWARPGVAPGFFDMFVLAFVERLFRPTYRKESELVLKKATKYGAVEIWMNERVRRACASCCADFVYGFLESSTKGKGREYWLIWRYEGESTLSDLMLSKNFPYNVES